MTQKIIAVFMTCVLLILALPCQIFAAETTIKSDSNRLPSGSYLLEKTSSFNIVGWAFDTDGADTSCYYQIDNGDEILLPRVNRSDVKAAFTNCSQLDCGFNYNIPSSQISVGSHTIKTIARTETDSAVIGTSTFTVTSNLRFSVDAIPSGTLAIEETDKIKAMGWVFDSTGLRTDCYYKIDSNAEKMMPKVTRNDVKNAFSDCSQADCGFNYYIPTSEITLGKHTISVIAKNSNGEVTLKTSEFTAVSVIKKSVDKFPSGDVTADDANTLKITGWAFNTNGAQTDCYCKIDNGSEIAIPKVTRNDVKNAFSDCQQADCGFDFTIPVDDLSLGTHTVYLIAKYSGISVILKSAEINLISNVKIKSKIDKLPSGQYIIEDNNFITLEGWAYNRTGQRTDCYYIIDNGAENALPKVDRSDVKNLYSDCTQLDCGFKYNLSITQIPLGKHTIKIIARSGSEIEEIASSEITLASNAHINCSSDYAPNGNYPADTDLIHIAGWAYSSTGATVRCYFQIDDGEMIEIASRERSDVVKAFKDCTQLDCGYYQDISLRQLNVSLGPHTFKAIAKCGSVTKLIKQTEFTLIGDKSEIKSFSENAPTGTYNLAETQKVRISGWAYNINGDKTKCYGHFDDGKEFLITTTERVDVRNLKDDCYRTDCGYSDMVNIQNLTEGRHTFTAKIKSDTDSAVAVTTEFNITAPTYTVNFNANSGTGAPNSLTKKHGVNLVVPSQIPTKNCYKFTGWNTKSDGTGTTYKLGESYNINASATLYAMWERDTFTAKSNAQISIDEKNKMIYGSDIVNATDEQLKQSFANGSISVSSKNVVTGTEITLTDSGKVYDKANLVILGDINCDGKIDATDAIVAMCINANMLDKNTLSAPVLSAADCERDGNINEKDIAAMLDAGLYIFEINQNAVSSRGFYDTDFKIQTEAPTSDKICFNGESVDAEIIENPSVITLNLNQKCESFNYFGIAYSSETYVKGTLTYTVDGKNHSEQFFLEPSKMNTFYSFIDGCLENVRAGEFISIKFEPLNSTTLDMTVYGVATFNRATPEIVTHLANEQIKIGINLDWGGSLSYYEDLDSNVQAVSHGGIIQIDSNAAERYSEESRNDNVNLINCHDAGRLVQQSYYGTTNYEMGFFNGHYVAYNPVQGGNMYNDASKIVDLRIDGNTMYVKCRPLDWAKAKEYITDSYMEATYTLIGETLKSSCRFVDFSGYDPATAGQELPAFYGAATMDRFVYYSGENPWTDGELSTATHLDEYEYAHYPVFTATEKWGALMGEFDDSFGIGLYVPDSTRITAGVYGKYAEQTENPDISDPTSYLAGGRTTLFQSFDPIEYDFYITTGTVDEIRGTFKSIALSD